MRIIDFTLGGALVDPASRWRVRIGVATTLATAVLLAAVPFLGPWLPFCPHPLSWPGPPPWSTKFDRSSTRVRDVHLHLTAQRELAYTTVMTVLDNLYRKGWVVRELDRRAYRYQPARSREDAAVLALRELLESTGDPEAVLLHFTRSVSDRELAVLRKGIRGRSRTT